MEEKRTKTLYTKNFIFGVEDSLVSTVGLLSGVAAASIPKHTIFVTGIILIFVEAFSMGIGSFLSEQSATQFAGSDQAADKKTVASAVIMFFSYFLAGFVPLSPYIILEVSTAFTVSIGASLVSLFLLGSLSAKYFKHRDILRHGIQMLILGGIAVTAGVVVGKLLQ